MIQYSGGNLIKSYLLDKKLGEGGEAEVWKAKSTENNNLIVAIKLREPVLFTEREKLNKIKERVDKETESWLQFKSLYVIQLYDRFTELQNIDNKECIVTGIITEYSEMGDLFNLLVAGDIKQYIKNELDLVRFLLNIIGGLQSGHKNNLIHCDIKPSNILLFMEGDVLIPKITDFGISRAFHESSIGGTKGYMAPELEEQGATPSISSDVYSLGITFYEIFYACLLEDFTKDDLATNYESGESYKIYIESLYQKTKDKVEIPIDKYLSVFSSMVKYDSKDRISLGEVRRFLELNKGILASQDYPKYLKIVQENIYRWNPKTHILLNHTLNYVFLRGGIPNIDINNLSRSLREAHIAGYSIHSVSGAWDYILRVWGDKNTLSNRLEKALNQFNQTVDGPNNLELEVLESYLFEKTHHGLDMTEDEVINKIKACVNEDDRAKEYKLLKKEKLVLSKLAPDDDKHFRVFVLIAINGVGDKIIGLIGNQLQAHVNSYPRTTETSMYLIGSNTSGVKILLKFT
ncbi:MAG: protein kinase [Candidatus Sedimenticola sp. (ex Thyasira tokunagai)]